MGAKGAREPPRSVTRKLIEAHRLDGRLVPGEEVALRIDQVLLQDATGALTMLALEAMALDRVQVDLAAQYVDHNLFQADFRNPDDHIFLETASRRFGVWFSRPGNGISHPVHMEALGAPGATLAGADSHSCSAGSMGMLGFGAGSLDIAALLAGEPLHLRMPEVWGVRLSGALPPWCSAKDVILEMLRRHSVRGGVGRIIEYHGTGVTSLSAMDRHVIANMGAELGATTSVFPSDGETRAFLDAHGRGADWRELKADPGADYDLHDEIDLGAIVPLIAKPSSPGNVVPVRDVAGEPVYQSYVGSSANPGFRDFAICAHMVRGRQIAPGVSFDINPSTRRVLLDLMRSGLLADLVQAGGRLHQAGCNGCMGMGQAPATGRNSLRTVPRNFLGRSGTKEDSVFLCSPETATASALTGRITDPRDLDMPYPLIDFPTAGKSPRDDLIPPLPLAEARKVQIVKGPSIASLPPIEPLADNMELPVLMRLGDDVSTDDIVPAGAEAMPLRSNVQKISRLSFSRIDETYVRRAEECQGATGHAIVGGTNYGQGSSREHAALGPSFLGTRAVIAKSFARIHWQNLVNAGVLPLTFADAADHGRLKQGDVLTLADVRRSVQETDAIRARLPGKSGEILLRHQMSPRQVRILLVGGLVTWLRGRSKHAADQAATAEGGGG